MLIISRYVTIQRGGEPTTASVLEDDSINQVGGDIVLGKREKVAFVPIDAEFLFSLAKSRADSGRVKRSVDSIDIVYPSDSPSTDPPDPTNSFLVSNDVSYVYPQTYNPTTRDSRQTSSVLTTISTSPNPTLPSLNTNPSFTSSYPTVTPSQDTALSPQHTSVTTTNKLDQDYDDWGVVVSVVKSMSESDSSITIIQQRETTQPVSEDYSETTTQTPSEMTTTITNQLYINSSPTPKVPSIERDKKQSAKIHPFLSSVHKLGNNISDNSLHTPKIHPFLNQIKSSKGGGGVSSRLSNNGVTTVPQNTSITKNISTSLTTTTTATPTKLFSRFSFLNKGRRPGFLHSAKSNSTSKDTSGLKNIQSRISNFKRPKLSAFNSKLKKNKKDVSNEISVTERTKSTKSTKSLFSHKKSNFLSRFNFNIKSSHAASTTREPPRKVEKPRPKRLPSPFGGSRSESLFKPRPNRFFTKSVLEKSSTTASPTLTTDKQTVGDLIAQLNGDDNDDEEKTATLRPHNFKPKFGVSNKIREKLQAELAEVNIDESEPVTAPTKANEEILLPTRITHREISRLRMPLEARHDRTENKLGGTVVTDNPDLTIPTEGEDTVDIVHDGPTLTTNNHPRHSLPSTHSPFQVLLDSTNEDQAHEDHVHDLVHDHHPQIHFRHLQPDLQPDHDHSVFLPTMSTFETSTVTSTIETVDPSSSPAPARSRSRSRSRYRQPASRASVGEQRRTRLQVRRRNRVQTERPNTGSKLQETSSSNRESPRLRVRQRSRQPSAESDRDPTVQPAPPPSRFTNSRRLISRARTGGSQASRAPAFRARGGSRVRTTPEPVRERTEAVTEVTDFIVSVEEDNDEEILLEGKSTRVDLDTATEGVDTVTTLTLNENEEYYEEKVTTLPEEEAVTISPGKFKPKFGSDTRRKLREKLRQELLQNKTREEAGDGEISEVLTDRLSGVSITNLTDLNRSHTDTGTLRETTTITTTAKVILKDVKKEYLDDDLQNSHIQSRRQRRINKEDSSPIELVTFDRRHYKRDSPERKLSDNPHHQQGQTPGERRRMVRVGRSTVGGSDHPATTTSAGSIKPFLLKGGKGYLKDQQERGERSSKLENISGPRENKKKMNKSKKSKKSTNIISEFGVKEVGPSVGQKGLSDSVNVGITLDSGIGPTQAPNSLTTIGLVSSLPKLNSSKSEIASGKYKNLFKLRKERMKSTARPSQDSRIKAVKVDQQPIELGLQLLLTQ